MRRLDPPEQLARQFAANAAAWQQILGVSSGARRNGGERLEGLKLYFTPPERQWLLGMEQHTPQAGMKLRLGARVWLY